jgi:hypothetical protein
MARTAVILVAAALALLTGCLQYVPTRTTLVDAETGEPIVGATVSIGGV